MSSFWFWFMKPFAEMAYGIAIIGLVVICGMIYYASKDAIAIFKRRFPGKQK